MPSRGIEKRRRFSLLLKRDRKSTDLSFFQIETENMNELRIFAYGIALSSLVWSSFNEQDRATVAATENGILTLVANGEDFVRQGFVSKDGWQIDFDRLYVNISNAVSYSTESTFEPQKGDTKDSIKFQNKANFDPAGVVDLAEGEADALPVVVARANVVPGFYNALAWQLDTAQAGSPIAGKTMALIGRATKEGKTIDFNLSFNRPVEYICGEFVGENRQGIVEANSSGQIETTFHFDHIFGDADTPAEDALNQDALGFQPLANLASNGTIELDDGDLASQLSEGDYQTLTEAVANLGHVGEGHCVIDNSQ